MKNICVFCGSSLGLRPAYQQAAATLGTIIAQRRMNLIYGGSKVGLMGIIADAVLAGGGEVIGVIPEFIDAKEIAHTGLTKLYIVNSMHERKSLMADFSDGFIAMPGGFGTFEEFFEVLTWGQLGLHQKPHGLLNIEGYYDPLLKLVDTAIAQKFIREAHRNLILTSPNPESLLDSMINYQPINIEKWIDKNTQT